MVTLHSQRSVTGPLSTGFLQDVETSCNMGPEKTACVRQGVQDGSSLTQDQSKGLVWLPSSPIPPFPWAFPRNAGKQFPNPLPVCFQSASLSVRQFKQTRSSARRARIPEGSSATPEPPVQSRTENEPLDNGSPGHVSPPSEVWTVRGGWRCWQYHVPVWGPRFLLVAEKMQNSI